MKDIANFSAGFRRFQEKYFSENRELFAQLRQGPHPKAAPRVSVTCIKRESRRR
jgi:carbonic anhydrase